MKVGVITLMTAMLFALPAWAGPGDPCAGQPDTDSDGHTDPCDNCLVVANVSQTDADSDGCGNVCDADFNNDGTVGGADFASFAGAWASSSLLHDIGLTDPPQPDGTVGGADFANFAAQWGGSPGPSGTTSGTTACP